MKRNLIILVLMLATAFPLLTAFPSNHSRSNLPAPDSHVRGPFLDLPLWQLKLIGITGNHDGLFYKNQNPAWKALKNRYSILCFSLTDKIYDKQVGCKNAEEMNKEIRDDKLLLSLPLTNFDFEPVLVTNGSGDFKWDAFTVLDEPAMKLVPVRINMADLQMKQRTDWIIIWFPPSDGLRKALDGYVNIDDYLLSPSEMKKGGK
jgi:hypothetical protein